MKASTIIACLTVALLGMFVLGCSFSASASVGKEVLYGNDAIVVKAKQPPAPVKPKPIVKRKAKVVGKKIEITEKVMFQYDKAVIKPDSHALLGDVAAVMKEHKNIKKVRIEGNTDGDGSDRYNKKLSQNRAEAVQEFLVGLGVEVERLESVGYGEERPLATNDTAEGREKNRRVEFNILERDEPAYAKAKKATDE